MFYLQFAQVLKTAFFGKPYGLKGAGTAPSTKKTVEHIIDRNLSEDLEYRVVDASLAWMDFLDEVVQA